MVAIPTGLIASEATIGLSRQTVNLLSSTRDCTFDSCHWHYLNLAGHVTVSVAHVPSDNANTRLRVPFAA